MSKKLPLKHSRPSWDEYFMEVARLVSRRATCLRRSVGAVLVKDKKILATGYNGAPSGLVHCLDIGCIREKLQIPSGQRHELCLPAGEMIFTSEGYVPINKVQVGQRVLTHKGIYRKITKVFKREYKGELCSVEPWNLLPVALTPAHPVLVIRPQKCQFDERTLCKETCKSVNNAYCDKPYLNYKSEWLPAGDLKEKDIVSLVFDNRSHSVNELDLSFVTDASPDYYSVLEERHSGATFAQIQRKLDIWPSTAYNWVGGGIPRNCIAACDGNLKYGSSPSKTIPQKVPLTKDLLRLIGFYLAEGSSSSNQVAFSFHRKEKAYINEVKNTMKHVFGLDCYESKRDNVHVLVYSSIILAKAFKILFGQDCYTKKLPHFLTKLSAEELRPILSAYAQGDGYRIDEYTTTVTTVSNDLALQVMQILLRLGYIPMIDIDKKRHYRLIWKEKYKIPYAYLKNNAFFSPIRKIRRKLYSGYVYNLEVETDNSYVTKSFIVHNCRGLHAEQNVILQAALYGVGTKESTLYCTNQPCSICAKMLVNAGVKEIVIAGGYPDKMAVEFLREARIKVRKIKRQLA